MMRSFLLAVLCGVGLLAADLPTTPKADLVGAVASLPVQHEGRIKPFDSVARHFLLTFSGRKVVHLSADEKMKASAWFLELISGVETADDRRVIHIANPRVSDRLGLELKPDYKFRWTFNELRAAVAEHEATFDAILQLEEGERDLQERQLAELANKLQMYRGLQATMSCVAPHFSFRSEILAERHGIPTDSYFSPWSLLSNGDSFVNDLRELVKKRQSGAALSAEDRELDYIAKLFHELSMKRQRLFGLIPTPAHDDAPPTWLALWDSFDNAQDSPTGKKIFDHWEVLLRAQLLDQPDQGLQAVAVLKEIYGPFADLERLDLELRYNGVNPYAISTFFYMLGLILLAASFAFLPRILGWSAFATLAIGLVIHAAGISMRVVILDRPPVGNLYESIIFVAAVSALGGIILELILRNRLGTFIGLCLALILQQVGFGYADDGDSLGMLVAVLRSRFWLLTHVLTITVGYALTYIASLIGHVALVAQFAAPGNKALHKHHERLMLASSLIALFFTLFGTILGGIWADQSWGRFWGWDPKENGALWIVLWLLFLLHARISGVVGARGFALGLCLVAIVVTLAWFGVNLLGVGLHSYGFTDSILWKLGGYTFAQIVVALGLYWTAVSVMGRKTGAARAP